jgi:hypothetical protein
MTQATQAAASKFFKYTAFTARRHPSIQQSEHLKWNPVPGFTSWYETDFKNNVHYASVINLQNVSSGNVTKIELTPNFPAELPHNLIGAEGRSIREIVKNLKQNSQLQ